MPDRLYRRLTWYAAYQVGHLPVMLLLLARGDVWALVAVFVISVPLLLSIGPFQAALTTNDGLDEAERSRWRVALFLLPWSAALYWYLWVRPLRAL